MNRNSQLRSGLLFSLLLYIAGCGGSPDLQFGNGFFAHSPNISWGRNPYEVSIYLKRQKANILIWESVLSSYGGPILLPDGGLLFCANDADKNKSLFVSDDHGRVAKITPKLLSQLGLTDFGEIDNRTNQIRILGTTSKFGTTNATCLPEDVVTCAQSVLKSGKNRRFNGVTYFF